jgi:hypothetical protein
MRQVIPRGDFLRLVRVKPSTLDQRVMTGEAAFALGCQRPAHVGEYLILDAVAMLLASMLNCFAGLELKAAADEVREHWDGWLTLLTKAERFPLPDHSEQFFAVAWLSLEPGLSRRRYRIVMGEAQKIAEALAGESVYTTNFVSMHLLLRHLRANAQLANIKLPERLTIDDDEPGYENWRAEIRAYQERAEARFRARAKAKGRRPARARARVT